MIKKTSETRPLTGTILNVANNTDTNTYSCDYINKIIKTATVTGTTNINGELYLSDYPISNYIIISAYVINYCTAIATNSSGTEYAITVLQRGTITKITDTQVTVNIAYIEK